MGPKKMDTSVKRVTFENKEVDETEEMEQPTASVRAVFRKSENNTSGIDISRFEARLKKTEDDVQETKSAVRQILDILTGKNQARSRPPQRPTSPRQSPNRGNINDYNCGEPGHYSTQCNRPRNQSPQKYRQRSPSPKSGIDPLNFKGLKI